jgi:hypothetical protein
MAPHQALMLTTAIIKSSSIHASAVFPPRLLPHRFEILGG